MMTLPPKKQVALALLERSSVFIHLDPRREQVSVPRWFKSQPQLVLQIGLNMAVRIPDLDIDDDAVSCTLSFNRLPHFCYVPWSAIYALVGEDGRGMVWPDDVPAEVASQSGSTPPPRPKNSLRPIAGGGEKVQSDRPPPKLRSIPPPPKMPSIELSAAESGGGMGPRPGGLSESDAGRRRRFTDAPRYPSERTPTSYLPPPMLSDLGRSVPQPRRTKKRLPSYLRVVK